jgi:hypothetical protein
MTVSGGCADDSHCIDGYCCDTLCSGQCQACDIKGKLGICSPVPSGPPHAKRDKCTGDGLPCAGSCNGKSDGTCDYPKVDCGDASCAKGSTNMFQDHGKCSAGTCQMPDPKECRYSLICSNNACKTSCTSKSDCMPGLDCDSNGKCFAPSIPITLTNDTSKSGYVTSKGDVPSGGRLVVGDDANNIDMFSFVYFDTSKIPKGSVIESAALVLTQVSTSGDPYGALGHMKAQKVIYQTLTAAAFNLQSNPNDDRTMFTDNTKGSHEANVSSQLIDDFAAGRTSTQFRLRFEKTSDGDNGADCAQLDPSGKNQPTLQINYHQP